MSEIYNQKCANINVASPRIQANEKWLVYGTGEPTGWGLSVAEGATVTLSNVYLSDASIRYMGNNTIILADGTTNIVKEVNVGSPAIDGRMATAKTLTITGTGTLNVTGKDYNPAIGAPDGSCGDIIIESTVHLTATAGADVSKAITTNGGGTVTIGGVEYAGGADSPFVYPAPAPAAKAAAETTAEDKGKLIGTDGNIYADVAAATAAGTTAVAKIIYIGTTGHATYSHGLALALTDEASTMTWQAAIDACSAKNTSTPVTDATWLLASKDQWNYMLGTNGAGSYTALRDGFGGITGVSNLQSVSYWSSTERNSDDAQYYSFRYGIWSYSGKGSVGITVRACLAF